VGNYNIWWAANIFCSPPKKFTNIYPVDRTKQTKRYGPTVLYSTNRKLRSTSTCRIESTHPHVESAHPMKKSFPRYCRNCSVFTTFAQTISTKSTTVNTHTQSCPWVGLGCVGSRFFSFGWVGLGHYSKSTNYLNLKHG